MDIKIESLNFDYKTYRKHQGANGAWRDFIHRNTFNKSALKDINLSVKRGEVVGLIGPNGAGKTTLIKLLTGVIVPTSGSLMVGDFIPANRDKKYLKKIGVLLAQKTQLNWSLPPIDTLNLLKEIYEIPNEVFKRRLKLMTARLNVADSLETPVRKLSLGERMKFELIASVLHGPELLILDEPTIGLDIVSQREVRAFITELNQTSQTTIIITSHNMVDIEATTSRVLVLMDGKLAFDGTTGSLGNHYAAEKVYNLTFNTDTYDLSTSLPTIEDAPRHVKIVNPGTEKIELQLDQLESIEVSTPNFEDTLYALFQSEQAAEREK